MIKVIDNLLDRITMYRLMLYYLIALVSISVILSTVGVLHFNAVAIIASTVFLVVVCWLSSQLFAHVFEVATNIESSYITALILTLIITPLNTPHNALFLAAAGGLAIASKYILAIGGKHIFNPVAIAVVLTAFGARQSASWWVGTTAMLPYVVIGGLLIVRKLRHGKMVTSFFAATLLSTAVVSIGTHGSITTALSKTVLRSSLFFLAFVMLTEPLTSPTTERKQLVYGGLAGLLFPPQIHLAGFYSTPELALVISNLFAYTVSPKRKLTPQLIQKIATGPDTADLVFALNQPMAYKPGQYMEWTLGHDHADARGNRRFFTLASSPTENTLRLGIKFYESGSSFKQAMLAMDKTTRIAAAQLAGDFVLPDDTTQKLVFIAGGIGVTPYRSMVKYLLDSGEKRDAVLFYSENKPKDFIYTDVFDEARRSLGIKVVYTLTSKRAIPANWSGQTGTISKVMIIKEVPDYRERYFYISGPHSMVIAIQGILHSLGIPNNQIKTDFFPGYA